MYIAHSKNDVGDVHYLLDHLTAVAESTAEFAHFFNAEDLGYYTGLWHDIGKFHPDFQSYLYNPDMKRSQDHKTAGAIYALQFLEILAFPIIGHHGGLPDKVALQQRIKDKLQHPLITDALRTAQQQLSNLLPTKKLTLPEFIDSNPLLLEMFIRMLFSALVDSDYLDTEAHFAQDKFLLRNNQYSMSLLWETFNKYHMALPNSFSTLNKLRNEMYQACIDNAEDKPGIYSLTMPTGAGKTLSGMGFALKHGVKNNMRRVIVAIPFTSIIEQTADVYRNIFGSEMVLEHHSALAADETEQCNRQQLAAENWDAPIIVTTTVQLFESLFHHKPARCRKLHNIAGSIIILDEVQTLPVHLLEPILDVLQQLVDHYGVTVVLCTATQPALTNSPYLKGLRGVKEIIPNPRYYFEKLKRVEYRIESEHWTWERVAQEMLKYRQCLTIVNTKQDAIELLRLLDDPDWLHISTLLCGAHRRQVLADVKKRLKENRPCRLVSTQVIEAGVDIDFPVVMRAMGPLDRIVQAAGRCNREGKLTNSTGQAVQGQVIIFNPVDGNLPLGVYRSATDKASIVLNRKNIDLHQPELFQEYFSSLYQVAETDAQGIQQLREKLDYPAVAGKFRLIDDDTVPVVVRYQPYLAEIDRLTGLIQQQKFVNRSQLRQLQPFIVNIYRNKVPRLLAEGYLQELCAGLYQWIGDYDQTYGLREKSMNPEELIF